MTNDLDTLIDTWYSDQELIDTTDTNESSEDYDHETDS